MKDFEKKVTDFLHEEKPFLFIIDFNKSKKLVYSLEEAAEQNIYFNIKGKGNDNHLDSRILDDSLINLHPEPISKEIYQKAFDTVKKELNTGNSFLLNLTFPTTLNTTANLKEIYRKASAPYKLLYKDKFVLFSPECYQKLER